MTSSVNMKYIGYISTDFKEKFGIPRQSNRSKAIGRIVLLPEYRNKEALRGIDGFSHLWLIFDFSESHIEKWHPTVRPPRLGGNKRVGVFATRSPFRPNPLGLSSVRFEGIEHTENDGDVIVVSGVDLLDGTPIFDIKPYIPASDSHPDAVGGFSDDVSDYHIAVIDEKNALDRIPDNKKDVLISALSDDPRPSYHDEPNREYSMRFSDYDVKFKVNDGKLFIIDIIDI